MLSLAPAVRLNHSGWMPNRTDDQAELKLLGKALAYLRERAGLTQFEAGDRVGITFQGWAKYEAGRAPTLFKPDTQRRMTGVLDATPEDLLLMRDRIEQGFPVPPVAAPGVSEPDTPAYVVGVSTRVRVDDAHMLAYDLRRADARIDLSWMFTPDAGFLRMAGSHLAGLVENGEILVFDRRQWPSKGDICVVELLNGSTYVYEFVSKSGSSLYLAQRDPPAQVEFNMDAVRGVYAVRMRGT